MSILDNIISDLYNQPLHNTNLIVLDKVTTLTKKQLSEDIVSNNKNQYRDYNQNGEDGLLVSVPFTFPFTVKKGENISEQEKCEYATLMSGVNKKEDFKNFLFKSLELPTPAVSKITRSPDGGAIPLTWSTELKTDVKITFYETKDLEVLRSIVYPLSMDSFMATRNGETADYRSYGLLCNVEDNAIVGLNFRFKVYAPSESMNGIDDLFKGESGLTLLHVIELYGCLLSDVANVGNNLFKFDSSKDGSEIPEITLTFNASGCILFSRRDSDSGNNNSNELTPKNSTVRVLWWGT